MATKNRTEFLIYLAGVFVLGLLTPSLRAATGSGGLTFAVVIAWLVLLRLAGWAAAKRSKLHDRV